MEFIWKRKNFILNIERYVTKKKMVDSKILTFFQKLLVYNALE